VQINIYSSIVKTLGLLLTLEMPWFYTVSLSLYRGVTGISQPASPLPSGVQWLMKKAWGQCAFYFVSGLSFVPYFDTVGWVTGRPCRLSHGWLGDRKTLPLVSQLVGWQEDLATCLTVGWVTGRPCHLSCRMLFSNHAVAQRVDRWTCDQQVVG